MLHSAVQYLARSDSYFAIIGNLAAAEVLRPRDLFLIPPKQSKFDLEFDPKTPRTARYKSLAAPCHGSSCLTNTIQIFATLIYLHDAHMNFVSNLYTETGHKPCDTIERST
jgi:hypothetical protein